MIESENNKTGVGFIAVVGLLASFVAILGFLGVSSLNDLFGRATTTTTSPAFRDIPITDSKATEREYVRAADEACDSVMANASSDINRFANNQNTIVPWTQKILEYRDKVASSWLAIPVPNEELHFRVRSMLRDYQSANAEWREVVVDAQRGNWASVKAHHDAYTRYDDSATSKARDAGLVVCSHIFPRMSF